MWVTTLRRDVVLVWRNFHTMPHHFPNHAHTLLQVKHTLLRPVIALFTKRGATTSLQGPVPHLCKLMLFVPGKLILERCIWYFTSRFKHQVCYEDAIGSLISIRSKSTQSFGVDFYIKSCTVLLLYFVKGSVNEFFNSNVQYILGSSIPNL